MRVRVRHVASIVVVFVVGGLLSVSAHNGFVIPAHAPGGAITIDGNVTTDAAAWGAGTTPVNSPNTCQEFTTGTGSPVTVFAARDAGNVYVAMRIPDTSPSAAPFPPDRLVLFFDANHSASGALQGDDVAFDFPFTDVTAPIANPRMFTGTSPNWTQAGVFPAGVQAAYTRDANELVFEVKIPNTVFTPPPPANAAIGFSFVYLNQTQLECSPGELSAFKV